jgi:hypothetical protein
MFIPCDLDTKHVYANVVQRAYTADVVCSPCSFLVYTWVHDIFTVRGSIAYMHGVRFQLYKAVCLHIPL